MRIGNTRFVTPPEELERSLDDLVAALGRLESRADLTPIAKAGWAGDPAAATAGCQPPYHVMTAPPKLALPPLPGYMLLALHPFADGNGRVARGLVNAMLARGGLPFVVGLARTEAQRDAYRQALVTGHSRGGDTRLFAAVVQASVAGSWAVLLRSYEGGGTPMIEV